MTALPTVPGQSAIEKRLHRDPEYCRLIRIEVLEMRQASARDRDTRKAWSLKERAEVVRRKQEREEAATREVKRPRRVKVAEAARANDWKAGDMLTSSLWAQPRRIDAIDGDTIWVRTLYGRSSHSFPCATLPGDTRRVDE